MKEEERVERILECLMFDNERDARFLGNYIKKLRDSIKKLKAEVQNNV